MSVGAGIGNSCSIFADHKNDKGARRAFNGRGDTPFQRPLT